MGYFLLMLLSLLLLRTQESQILASKLDIITCALENQAEIFDVYNYENETVADVSFNGLRLTNTSSVILEFRGIDIEIDLDSSTLISDSPYGPTHVQIKEVRKLDNFRDRVKLPLVQHCDVDGNGILDEIFQNRMNLNNETYAFLGEDTFNGVYFDSFCSGTSLDPSGDAIEDLVIFDNFKNNRLYFVPGRKKWDENLPIVDFGPEIIQKIDIPFYHISVVYPLSHGIILIDNPTLPSPGDTKQKLRLLYIPRLFSISEITRSVEGGMTCIIDSDLILFLISIVPSLIVFAVIFIAIIFTIRIGRILRKHPDLMVSSFLSVLDFSGDILFLTSSQIALRLYYVLGLAFLIIPIAVYNLLVVKWSLFLFKTQFGAIFGNEAGKALFPFVFVTYLILPFYSLPPQIIFTSVCFVMKIRFVPGMDQVENGSVLFSVYEKHFRAMLFMPWFHIIFSVLFTFFVDALIGFVLPLAIYYFLVFLFFGLEWRKLVFSNSNKHLSNTEDDAKPVLELKEDCYGENRSSLVEVLFESIPMFVVVLLNALTLNTATTLANLFSLSSSALSIVWCIGPFFQHVYKLRSFRKAMSIDWHEESSRLWLEMLKCRQCKQQHNKNITDNIHHSNDPSNSNNSSSEEVIVIASPKEDTSAPPLLNMSNPTLFFDPDAASDNLVTIDADGKRIQDLEQIEVIPSKNGLGV